MDRLLNYTPHRNLAYLTSDGGLVPLPPLGNARAEVEREPSGTLAVEGGLPVYAVRYGEVRGLPDPTPGVYLVVSMLVAQLLPEREDLVFPDELVRDEEGTIIGFTSVGRLQR